MEPSNESKNGNLVGLALLGIIAVVVVIGFILSQGQGSNTGNSVENKVKMEELQNGNKLIKESTEGENDTLGETGESTTSTPSATGTTQVKEFIVKGSNFKFDITEIKVKVGDKVKMTFENTGGFHDWNLDEFNVGTKVLNIGEKETVEFTASKAGTFEYYCSVGQHRQMGMKGNLIVE
ncbi:hypothetical protein A3F07_04355 [candidate division WWE3 bacterium RIFCSPHIGHO2_12_FULL_38_15]|uniref:EfeO-type cupredoxin-like domain-containing protein n=1 Tax=candidate division WWE3 bacterium RIFCSPHIGHO2_02_FULL_38_14 TaxID=1802620 RepID=A0A1F4V7W8_UNCKA|nr:MAG: hypothetical protein A3F07_04355 [candidate division WWE3 bacterium RIFCSPHIGHO2_12_FULL_38_15]OGC52909.1 MAG: hypothetical protein A3B64_02780 [candidate division WWE3 bacterium RIFCSPLOWO2_01_FULL_37_24]OGC53312.1 MAG: hypothetical protein A3D91_02795 [candidate division WWE3 bacterium RIFCSPHIGHO2_02_FULL_38_14]HLB51825.1 plastocyanin/azurin family copper-binding protein [Patescibacteria group bacterium]